MKFLKTAVVACSLFAAAAACAQDEAPAANASQTSAQNNSSSAVASRARVDAPKRARRVDDCVGPASFCSVYFGN